MQNYWETQTRQDLIVIKPLNKVIYQIFTIPRLIFNISLQDPSALYVRDDEIDAFANTVNEHINNIKFRMLSNQQRGRNIANDTAVQSVFLLLQNMYPEFQRLVKSLDDKQGSFFVSYVSVMRKVIFVYPISIL